MGTQFISSCQRLSLDIAAVLQKYLTVIVVLNVGLKPARQ